MRTGDLEAAKRAIAAGQGKADEAIANPSGDLPASRQ
jgi:hypothetical protein